jgi:hypothetical protein
LMIDAETKIKIMRSDKYVFITSPLSMLVLND